MKIILKNSSLVFQNNKNEIESYLDKLTTIVTSTQKSAFMAFGDKLKILGVYDKIDFMYPLWGNINDCKFGIFGNDLTIPSGAAYNKGIILDGVTGGYGALGNGIFIKELPTNNMYMSIGAYTNADSVPSNTYQYSLLLSKSNPSATDEDYSGGGVFIFGGQNGGGAGKTRAGVIPYTKGAHSATQYVTDYNYTGFVGTDASAAKSSNIERYLPLDETYYISIGGAYQDGYHFNIPINMVWGLKSDVEIPISTCVEINKAINALMDVLNA